MTAKNKMREGEAGDGAREGRRAAEEEKSNGSGVTVLQNVTKVEVLCGQLFRMMTPFEFQDPYLGTACVFCRNIHTNIWFSFCSALH